MLQILAVN